MSPKLGGPFWSAFAVGAGAHYFSCSPFPFCDGNRPNAPQASVDAIKQPAGGLPGKKIRVIFQCCRRAGRRGTLGRTPKLEVAQDFFDDRGVFDETDDA